MTKHETKSFSRTISRLVEKSPYGIYNCSLCMGACEQGITMSKTITEGLTDGYGYGSGYAHICHLCEQKLREFFETENGLSGDGQAQN